MTKPSFLGAKVFAKKNWENGPKLGFEFIEKFSLQFILNLFYNENLHCFIYIKGFCTDPIFGKIRVPEIWTTMLSANQIAWLFNQPQKKCMK